jgi:integrase
MAAIRKVRKHGRVRWRVSSYDALGQRHQRFFATKAEAEQHQADAITESRHRLAPSVDPAITLRDYAARWLPAHAADHDLKPRTIESYAATLRLHILPVRWRNTTVGDLRVSALRRPIVKALIARQRAAGHARDSVRITLAVLSALCEAAVDDDLLVANPAHRLRKKLRLTVSQQQRTEDVQALTQDELDRALGAARAHSPALFPLYVTLARTGLRIGEALALDDTDPEVFDFDSRRLRVRRAFGRHGTIDTPKSGYARDVDLSLDVVAVLKARIAEKKKAKLAGTWADLPRWTFCTSRGTPYSARNVLRDWYRVQRTAALVDADGAPRFNLKGLRHTFASLHILNGCNVSWLQDQLGHSDVRLTKNTYGRWFKQRDTAAADRQDARSALVVTEMVTEAGNRD